MLTLESDLNSKILEANAQQKEDTGVIKRELTQIKEWVTNELKDVVKQLEDHIMDLTILHEGKIHLELNLKMSTMKIGVTSLNTFPITEVVNALEEKNATTEANSSSVEKDMDGDFRMTKKVFDKVLEDFSRSRGPPPQKYRKVSTLTYLTGEMTHYEFSRLIWTPSGNYTDGKTAFGLNSNDTPGHDHRDTSGQTRRDTLRHHYQMYTLGCIGQYIFVLT